MCKILTHYNLGLFMLVMMGIFSFLNQGNVIVLSFKCCSQISLLIYSSFQMDACNLIKLLFIIPRFNFLRKLNQLLLAKCALEVYKISKGCML
jgi:hypothetical protein